MTASLIVEGMKQSTAKWKQLFCECLLAPWWGDSSARLWSPLASVQRFFPTHQRNTSDYSSDSSSTGNSPETQHNVSVWPPILGKMAALQPALPRLNPALSLLRLLGTHRGESPTTWPPGGCAITWVVSLSGAWFIDSVVYLWSLKSVWQQISLSPSCPM